MREKKIPTLSARCILQWIYSHRDLPQSWKQSECLDFDVKMEAKEQNDFTNWELCLPKQHLEKFYNQHGMNDR